MNKMVYSVFKTIMMAIILVFVFDMVMYLYRAMSLNQRMESLMTSLQKVVMENNYLPEEQAKLYQQLLYQMAADFNIDPGQSYSYTGDNTNFFQNNNDAFVLAIDWNYRDDATDVNLNVSGTRRYYNNSSGWQDKTVNIVHKKMGEVADYGDIQTVQIKVLIAQPMWGFMRMNGSGDDFRLDSDKNVKLNSSVAHSTIFTYTYYVPCLKYKSITQ